MIESAIAVSSLPEAGAATRLGTSATASMVTTRSRAAPLAGAAAPSCENGVTVSVKSWSLFSGKPMICSAAACAAVSRIPPGTSALGTPALNVTPAGTPEITTKAVSPGAPGVAAIGSAIRPPRRSS